jgi:hypothetical protein
MYHELKTLPQFYDEIITEMKRFEIRQNDRNFQKGDTLLLREWDGENYTGHAQYARVTYITDFEQKPGFVVMSVVLWDPAPNF